MCLNGCARVAMPIVVAALVLLGACAPVPTVMRYSTPSEQASGRVWPELPEVPRYRYVGELTGEDNFVPEEGYAPSTGEKVFRWLVGLGQRERDRSRLLVRPLAGLAAEDGRIFVVDAGRPGVYVFDERQAKLSIWQQADGGASFETPAGIAPGGNGEILVSDAELGRIVRLDAEGTPLGSIGAGVLERPTGLVRHAASGRIYAADSSAHDIKVFSDSGQLVARIGGPGRGYGRFNGPTHLSIANERLYVSDTLNARVQALTLDGVAERNIGRRGLYVGNLTRPKGVAVDADANVYVVESFYDHLIVFDRDGNYLLPIGGTGDGLGEFFLPAGLWTDAHGRVFIADMFNARVVILQYLGA